jgi:hypothetical protein
MLMPTPEKPPLQRQGSLKESMRSLHEKLGPSKSTRVHRNRQRGNVGAQLVTTTLDASSEAAFIIGRGVQFLSSAQALCKPNLKESEYFAHFMQATLAVSDLSIRTVCFFRSKNCTVETGLLCLLSLYIGYLYNAILLVSWGTSEVSKDKGVLGDEQDVSSVTSEVTLRHESPVKTRHIQFAATDASIEEKKSAAALGFFDRDTELTRMDRDLEQNLDSKI